MFTGIPVLSSKMIPTSECFDVAILIKIQYHNSLNLPYAFSKRAISFNLLFSLVFLYS